METATIMEQLVEATNAARKSGKIMYVFSDSGQWWYSGKLPEVNDFYVAYPNGLFDKSENARKITFKEWRSYLEQNNVPLAPCNPRYSKTKGKHDKPKENLHRILRILAFCCACCCSPSRLLDACVGYLELRVLDSDLL